MTGGGHNDNDERFRNETSLALLISVFKSMNIYFNNEKYHNL